MELTGKDFIEKALAPNDTDISAKDFNNQKMELADLEDDELLTLASIEEEIKAVKQYIKEGKASSRLLKILERLREKAKEFEENNDDELTGSTFMGVN